VTRAAGLLSEAEEIIVDCQRYLSEFGSVEPSLLLRRIRVWRDDLAREDARFRELAK